MMRLKEPPKRIAEFIQRMIELCREFDVEIIGTDDDGLMFTSGNETYGGDLNVLFYKITKDGLK